jgi:hypothetical protein
MTETSNKDVSGKNVLSNREQYLQDGSMTDPHGIPDADLEWAMEQSRKEMCRRKGLTEKLFDDSTPNGKRWGWMRQRGWNECNPDDWSRGGLFDYTPDDQFYKGLDEDGKSSQVPKGHYNFEVIEDCLMLMPMEFQVAYRDQLLATYDSIQQKADNEWLRFIHGELERVRIESGFDDQDSDP